MAEDRSGPFLAGFLVGGVLGFLGGLLAAPQPGPKTRKMLAEKGKEVGLELKEKVESAREFSEEALHRARFEAVTALRALRDMICKGKECVQEAVAAGKEEAYKRREELEKAVDDAIEKLEEVEGEITS